MLTVLMPTRNRSALCARQLRFLRDNDFPHPIVVLDASERAEADAVQRACAGVAEYRHFGSEFRMADKLAAAAVDIETPYVVLIPDDDVVLPHAIEAGMSFLDSHPDFIVADGYFIGFCMYEDFVDIHHVTRITPSIIDEQPLRRHYNLFRRYQSFYWGVFRTGVFRSAVTLACVMDVVMFRELTVMSASILQGKVARLPLVYALRGTAKSHAALHQSQPPLFMLRDAHGFFRNYILFRDCIATFIRRNQIETPADVQLEQLLDMIYGTYLGPQLDIGAINRTVRTMLGDPLPAIQAEPSTLGWEEPADGDVVHRATAGDRRYIWRKRVVEAEPRGMVTISVDEMARVERQLEFYR